MKLSLQKLLAAIAHDSVDLEDQINNLDSHDLGKLRDKDLNKITTFRDCDPNAKVKNIPFTLLLKFLYTKHKGALAKNLLDKFHAELSELELRKISEYRGKCASSPEYDKLYSLLSVIKKLKTAPEKLAVLLDNFNDLSEEAILNLLTTHPRLIYEAPLHYENLIKNDASMIGNLLHFSIYHNMPKLTLFLLQRAKNKLAIDYLHHGKSYPYWWLARDKKIFNILLDFIPKSKHFYIKISYLRAHLSSLMSGIVLPIYEAMLKDRRQVGWILKSLELNYHSKFGACVDVIESIISENTPQYLILTRNLLKKNPMGLLILHNALAKNTGILLQIIVENYQLFSFELLIRLATRVNLILFEMTLLRLKKSDGFKAILIKLFSALLACNLNAPLVLLLKTCHKELFSDGNFTDELYQHKNPKVLLLALSLGFKCVDVFIFETIAFAFLIGDKEAALQLVKYTDFENDCDWVELIDPPWGEFKPEPLQLMCNESDENLDAYGSCLSQYQYRAYHIYQAELIYFHFLRRRFSFQQMQDDKSNWKIGWEFIGNMRHQQAVFAHSNNRDFFGMLRQFQLLTPLNGQYESYRSLIVKNFLKTPELINDAYYCFDKDGVMITGEVAHRIDNQSYTLTSFRNEEDESTWRHTSDKLIPSLIPHIDKLITEFVSDHTANSFEEKSTTFARLALIHWYLAHTTPYGRGSASVSEALVTALFLTAGYAVTYSPLIDCEALSTPDPNQFIEKYRGFFGVHPVSSHNLRGFSTAIELGYKP